MLTKSELSERILRRFGYPQIKIELSTIHLFDAIDYATRKWKKWASGTSNQEVFLTKALSAGQYLYELPLGTQDVLSYESGSGGGGINTLFTMDNYMYSQGMYNGLFSTGGDGYKMISYQIAKDFLNTVNKFTPDAYNFKYHKYTNQLEIQPPPPSGGSLTYTQKLKEDCVEVAGDTVTIDSPGFILLRLIMLQGASYDVCYDEDEFNKNFWETSQWIEDYAAAYAKRTLGLIRRKFASFGSLGNQGIALDGSELISEADQEMERLGESLKLNEPSWGYGISIG